MDDAFVERVVEHLAGARKMHHHAHRETVHFRIEGTELIRHFLRQHWNDAVGEIDRCSPASSFDVHRGIRSNEVRNVRDMHTQLERSVGQLFHIDRIIKVARRRRIDGDRVSFSEIIAAGEIPFGQPIGERGSFLLDVVWKTGR